MKTKLLAITILCGAAALGYIARDGVPATAAKAVSPAVVAEPVADPDPEPAAPQVLRWVSEKDAKASGKPILYLATLSKGCVPCKQLAELFNNPASAEAMSRFACVKLTNPPANHPWLKHYRVTRFPTMVFVGSAGTVPYVQTGAPDSVPALLQFLDSMETRFSGKPSPSFTDNDPREDKTKTFIQYPRTPTLAPHDAVAPFPNKGRSSGGPERSCVTNFVRGGKCYRRSSGTIFRSDCASCR